MPYCDIDFTPKWDYDKEKARLLNCSDDDDGLSDGVIGGLAALGVLLGLAIILTFVMVKKEKEGNPMFTPLISTAA